MGVIATQKRGRPSSPSPRDVLTRRWRQPPCCRPTIRPGLAGGPANGTGNPGGQPLRRPKTPSDHHERLFGP